MSFEIPSLKKAISKRNVAQDLPSFRYQEVQVKEHIGNGAYGTLGKGQYNKEIIVTKKLNGESADQGVIALCLADMTLIYYHYDC